MQPGVLVADEGDAAGAGSDAGSLKRAVLACLAKPAPEAVSCIDASPALRAHAEMLIAAAALLPREDSR